MRGPRSRLFRAARLVVRLLVAGLIAFVALRLSGLAGGPYPASPALAFTPYLAALAAVIAPLAAALRDAKASVGAGLAAVVLAALVIPRATAEPQPSATGPLVRITTANLLYGRADPAALRAVIARRRPDILSLQELNVPYIRQLRRGGVLRGLPEQRLGPGRKYDNAGIATRWSARLRDVGLPEAFHPVDVQVPRWGPLTVIAGHPVSPSTPGKQRRWRAAIRTLPGPQGPLRDAIVAGDLNATLDQPQLRRLLAAGWRDAGAERGDALIPTWRGGPLRFTIDHVLVPPGVAVVGYAVDEVRGSDHRAVSVILRLPARPSRAAAGRR